MGRPTCVRDANVAVGLRFEVDVGACNDNYSIVNSVNRRKLIITILLQ